MSDFNDFNAGIIDEFRANHGRVGGMFEGAPVLIIHSRGAKSGQDRVHPVMYQKVDGGYAVFASKGGAPTNPDWYHNLVANPRTTIEVGDETIEVQARVAPDDERNPIMEEQKRTFPQFAEYEQKTTRKIPVVIFEPVS